jgi:DNA-binding CsgD family transcriptional regulator
MSQKLSPREIECLTWAAQGKTYTEIGMLAGISFATVKVYLDSGRYKLGATNLPHAVALAITFGLIFMTEEAIDARKDMAKRWYDTHCHGEFEIAS